jgi:hypothetical protein
MAGFVPTSAQPNKKVTNIGGHSTLLRVFLSVRAQIGSVSQLVRLNAAGGPWLPMSRRQNERAVLAFGPFDADHSLPVERQVDL